MPLEQKNRHREEKDEILSVLNMSCLFLLFAVSYKHFQSHVGSAQAGIIPSRAPAAVLTLTPNISLLRNLDSQGGTQSLSSHVDFFICCLVFLSLLAQTLLAPKLPLPRHGPGGVLTKQHLIQDPVRLWNLLGESWGAGREKVWFYKRIDLSSAFLKYSRGVLFLHVGGGGVCRDPGLCLVTGMSSGTFPRGAQGIKEVLELLDFEFVAFFGLYWSIPQHSWKTWFSSIASISFNEHFQSWVWGCSSLPTPVLGMAVPWELCPPFNTKEISPNYFPCAKSKQPLSSALPAGNTSWFATSSSRGSSQKNGGFKKKSPQEEDGMCVCAKNSGIYWNTGRKIHLCASLCL